MDKKREIADRLKQELQNKHGSSHGWKAAAACELEMTQQQLSDLTSDPPRRSPGNKVREKLRQCGYDDNYIITGLSRKEIDLKFEYLKEEIKQQALSEEEWNIITALRKLEVKTFSEFNLYFNYSKAVSRASFRALKVVETKSKHPTKKKER